MLRVICDKEEIGCVSKYSVALYVLILTMTEFANFDLGLLVRGSRCLGISNFDKFNYFKNKHI